MHLCRMTSGVRALVLAVLLPLPGVVRAEPVSGLVFLDPNDNGQYDAGEGALAGVAVTDGVGFAVTGADGRYRLEATVDPTLQPGRRPLVSVAFPSQTWPTRGWFRRLEEAADAGNVHFPLRTVSQAVPFTFVHATDCHLPRGGQELSATFRREVEAAKSGLAFCIVTGDLVNLGDASTLAVAKGDYDLLAAFTRDFPVPLFCVPGNHEPAGIRAAEKQDANDPAYGYGLYRSVIGPLRWSFNYAGYHVVGIDFNTHAGDTWKWGVPPSAAAWLARDLELAPKDAEVFLFVHWPEGDPGLAAALKGSRVRRIFSGHSHAEGPLEFAGVKGWQSGSLSQTGGDRKPGYRLVQVTAAGVESVYTATGDPHTITLEQPRAGQTLVPKAAVRGVFRDPAGTLEQLTVQLGAVSAVVPFQRTPLGCRFETSLDLAAEPEGFRRLQVTAKGGQETATFAYNYLLLSGVRAPFTPTEDAQVKLDVCGVDAGAEVWLNGQLLAPLAKTAVAGDGPFTAPVKGADAVPLPVARDRLLRLNTVELRVLPKPDGTPDAFCVLDVRLAYGGKDRSDPRSPHGPNSPRLVKDRTTFYLDLQPD